MEQIASRGYQIGDDDLAVTQPRKGLAVCACFTEEDGFTTSESGGMAIGVAEEVSCAV